MEAALGNWFMGNLTALLSILVGGLGFVLWVAIVSHPRARFPAQAPRDGGPVHDPGRRVRGQAGAAGAGGSRRTPPRRRA